MIISCPIHCGDGEWLIPFWFAAAFNTLEEMSLFSLSQLFHFFFVKLLFLYQIALFYFCRISLFVSDFFVSLELQYANNRTAAEACSGTHRSYLTQLAGCTAVHISLTALSGFCFPRLPMTTLSSRSKTSKIAPLDKLEPCPGHDPLGAH